MASEDRAGGSPTGTERGAGAFLPTRVTLLSRLRDWGDRKSWQEFYDTYWRLIFATARRAGLTEEEAKDVVQEVLVGASKGLPNFHYDPAVGSFKSWLMRITRRRIADCYAKRPPWNSNARREPATGGGAGATVEPDDLAAPGADAIDRHFEAEWKRSLLEAALRRVRSKVPHRQYQIFDLSVNQGRSVPEVCTALQVSRTQVYLARHRVAKRLRQEVARIREETGESEPE